MAIIGQEEEVLIHLYRRGSITSQAAFIEYGITRLSSVIHRLRKAGKLIQTKMISVKARNGRVAQIARYHLGKR